MAVALLALVSAGLVWRIARSPGPSPRDVYLALANTPIDSLPSGFSCARTRCVANSLKTLPVVGPGVVGEVVHSVVGPAGRRHTVRYRVYARGHVPTVSQPAAPRHRNLFRVGPERPLWCAFVEGRRAKTVCAGEVDSVALTVVSLGDSVSFDKTSQLAGAAVRHLLGILSR